MAKGLAALSGAQRRGGRTRRGPLSLPNPHTDLFPPRIVSSALGRWSTEAARRPNIAAKGSADGGEARLPSFRSPPVIELALGVRFEPIEGLRAVQIGRLYESRYGAEFPQVEEKGPIEIPIERFGRQARMPEFRFEVTEGPPAPRHWFVDETGTQLVQVQRDWFARNWRKTEDDQEYRRYPSVRQPFADDLAFLASFVQENGLGAIKPLQCEVTYVNDLRPVQGIWSDHGDLSAIMRIWRDDLAREWLPRPEEAQFTLNYVIASGGDPIGRLRIVVQPAFAVADDLPIYRLNLTARGAPLSGGDVDGVLEFLDLGHEWIVRAFDSVTSDAMHKAWEREP